MSYPMNIRAATRADLPDILRLYAQPALDDGVGLPMYEAELIFERMSAYPDYHVHVAVFEGRTVGTFPLLIMDNLAHMGAPSGVIEDVAVDPSFQGEGIGRAMMGHAIAVCKERGCYKVALSSNLMREAAHAFYESLGFVRHGYSYCVSLTTRSGR